MYEPKEYGPARVPLSPEAAGVIDWLRTRSTVEQALHSSLGGVPSERDVTLARMGDVLQATAQGVGPQAAALWAGVPEHVVQTWIAQNPAFGAALRATASLASAHGIRQGRQSTPAMVRVLLIAMSNGTTKYEAIKLSGFQHRRLRALVKSHSMLRALLEAARRARPAKARGSYVPGDYRPRRPGVKPPVPAGFRLVRRCAPGTADPEGGG
ncbi:hypothetical protein [Streptomyces lavendulae]|uniref:hypothetical protein n=1 Tax=Streptomyces lavendulae TaxID=1914 RepID=UPI003676B675